MNTWIVYSSGTGCQMCRMTIAQLEKNGHNVEVRDAETYREHIASLDVGLALPVVEPPAGKPFSGFRPARLG